MFKKTATGIALEDSGRIRLVELTSGVGGVSIRRAGSFEGVGTDLFQQWTAALREAASAEYDLDRVVIGLPSSLTFKKTLSFPFKGRKRINQVLLSQLEGEVPLSPDGAVADFLLSRTEGQGCTGMAVACRRQTIQGVLEILPRGAAIAAVQTDAIGLATAAVFGGVSNGAAVLCGRGRSVIAGLSGGKPSSFRRVSHAGNDVEGIAETTDAVLDATEEGGEVLVACEENRDELITSLELQGVKWAQDPHTWPVFRNFEGSLDGNDALFLPALGLALKGIGQRESAAFDLRQGPFRPINPIAELKVPAMRTAVLGALVLLLGAFSLISGLNRARADYEYYADSVRSSFAALFPDTKIVSEVAQIQERITQLERRTSSLEEFTMTGSLEVLVELSLRVPKDLSLKLNELAFDSGRLRIEGSVSSFDSVDRIKEALEASDLFEDVRVQNARVGADASKVSFRLQMEVI